MEMRTYPGADCLKISFPQKSIRSCNSSLGRPKLPMERAYIETVLMPRVEHIPNTCHGHFEVGTKFLFSR